MHHTLSAMMAAASGGGGGSSSDLLSVVIVTLLIGFGVGISHVLVHKLERRFVLISGLEYILIGALVQLSGILDDQSLLSLAPVVTLGIGLIGLSVGLQARRDRVPRIGLASIRGTAWTALTTVSFVLGGFLLWQWFVTGSFDLDEGTLIGMLVLAVTSIVSASDLITHVMASYPTRKGFVSRFIINTAWLSELVAIVAFGAIFCVVHLGQTTGPVREPTDFEWFGINLALGLLLGALFSLFLGRERDHKRLFVALIGIVVFASGLAFFLHLSALFITFVVGVWLAQKKETGRILLKQVQSIEKPIYVVLFIFAGAVFANTAEALLSMSADVWYEPWTWSLTLHPAAWALIVIYIVLRWAGKVAGGWLSYTYSARQERYHRNLGQGLVAQGGLVTAMALNYHFVYLHYGTSEPIIFNVLLFGVVINEIFAPRQLRDLLVDVGEIKLENTDANSYDETAFNIQWIDEFQYEPVNPRQATTVISQDAFEPPSEDLLELRITPTLQAPAAPPIHFEDASQLFTAPSHPRLPSQESPTEPPGEMLLGEGAPADDASFDELEALLGPSDEEALDALVRSEETPRPAVASLIKAEVAHLSEQHLTSTDLEIIPASTQASDANNSDATSSPSDATTPPEEDA